LGHRDERGEEGNMIPGGIVGLILIIILIIWLL
jgi:hypothetical protein